MSTFTGCEGIVEINDGGGLQIMAEVTSIEITRTANIKQYKTIQGDCTDKTKSLGTSFSVSVEGNYCPDDPGQAQLEEGKLVTVRYWPGGNATPATDPLYEGSVRIEELSVSASPDEDVAFSMSGIGQGALAKTNTF